MCLPLLILSTVTYLELGRDCLILPVADYNGDDSNNTGLGFMRCHSNDERSAVCVHISGQRPKGWRSDMSAIHHGPRSRVISTSVASALSYW